MIGVVLSLEFDVEHKGRTGSLKSVRRRGALYRTEFLRLSWAFKKKYAHYYSRYDQIIFVHDNVPPNIVALVKSYLKTVNWEVLIRHIHQTLALSSTTCFVRGHMTCLGCTSNQQKISKIELPQNIKRSSNAVSAWCQKGSDGEYIECNIKFRFYTINTQFWLTRNKTNFSFHRYS